MLAISLHWSNGLINFIDVIYFTLFVTFLVSLPFISYLIFKEKLFKLMPHIQTWINNNSWLISIACYEIFLLVILSSMKN